MSSHVPPPGFELVDARALTRFQRRAIKRAHKLDYDFFRRNPLRLTRVRRGLDGETDETAFFPGKRCFAVVRQIAPGAYHALFAFADTDVAAAASSESTAAWLYDAMLGDQQRDWSTKAKDRALTEILVNMPVRGEA